MPPFDDPGGFGDIVICPECPERGSEEEIRHHLRRIHSWEEQEIDFHFEEPTSENELTKIGGAAAPVSDGNILPQDNDGKGFENTQSDNTKVEDADTIDELCNCDPKYKDSDVIQDSKGGTLGPVGANRGKGTPIITCRNCGRWTEAKKSTENRDSDRERFGLL